MSQNARDFGAQQTGATSQKSRQTSHGFKPLALPALAAAARKGAVAQRQPVQRDEAIRRKDSAGS